MTEAEYSTPKEQLVLPSVEVSAVPTKHAQSRAMRRSSTCLNCGTPTPGNFCPACGQANDNLHVSTWRLVGEFLADYFTADLKFFKSLLPLLVRPGFLTREYMAGRRVRYIAPLRLYLFVSFAYFFLLPFYTNSLIKPNPTQEPPVVVEPSPGKKTPPSLKNKADDDDRVLIQTGDPSLDRTLNDALRQKARKIEETKGQAYLQQLLPTFIEHYPKVLFGLLPVFAFILKLLYLRRNRYYAEHLVFALHFHAFAFLVLTVDTLLGNLDWFVWTPLVLSGYLFVALKTVYAQSWLKTTLKFALLVSFYSLALILSLVVIAGIALLLV
jgi:hypothetical protein